MIHRPAGGYHQRNCVFCLWFIIAELLSAVFVCLKFTNRQLDRKTFEPLGLKFTNRQLDRKTFEVDKWVLLEIPTGQ